MSVIGPLAQPCRSQVAVQRMWAFKERNLVQKKLHSMHIYHNRQLSSFSEKCRVYKSWSKNKCTLALALHHRFSAPWQWYNCIIYLYSNSVIRETGGAQAITAFGGGTVGLGKQFEVTVLWITIWWSPEDDDYVWLYCKSLAWNQNGGSGDGKIRENSYVIETCMVLHFTRSFVNICVLRLVSRHWVLYVCSWLYAPVALVNHLRGSDWDITSYGS